MPTLYPHQAEGIEHIRNRFGSGQKGFCLADKPGVGKTSQSIYIINDVKETGPVLVIVPAYLIENWLDEFKLWGVDDTICVIDSRKQIIDEANIYLSSYDLSVYESIRKQLLKKKFSLLVCDEAHTFRTWNSQRSRYILGTFQNKKSNYLYRSNNVLLLTGTPVVNGVEDVYNIFRRIAPEVFEDIAKTTFITHFAARVWSTPWGLKHSGIKNEKQLAKMLENHILSRSVSGQLPSLTQKNIKLPIKKNNIAQLLEQEKAFLKQAGISEGDIINVQKMDTGQEYFATLRRNVAVCKIPVALPVIIEDYKAGHRPIVYCWHREVLSYIVEKLSKKCKNAVIMQVNGGIATKDRHKIVKDYQAGQIDILCCTIGALKEGVNLTKGTHVYFLELPYTPAELEQVCARLHRIGQQNPVQAMLFYFDAGVDAHVMKLLKSKKAVSDKLIKVEQVNFLS